MSTIADNGGEKKPIQLEKLITMPFITPTQDEQLKTLGKKSSDNLCVRFCRKKFLCIILFLLFLYSFLDLTHLLVKKSDSKLIQSVLNMTYQKMFTHTQYMNESANEPYVKSITNETADN